MPTNTYAISQQTQTQTRTCANTHIIDYTYSKALSTLFRSVSSIARLPLSRCASDFERWCAFSWFISSMLRGEPYNCTATSSCSMLWNFGAFAIVFLVKKLVRKIFQLMSICGLPLLDSKKCSWKGTQKFCANGSPVREVFGRKWATFVLCSISSN